MALTVDNIVLRASTTLQDIAGIRWTPAELVRYLSDGQRRVVALIPSSNSATTMHQVTAGTKQALPTVYLQLLDVTRNNINTGAAPGRAITRIDRAVLESENMDWHTKPLSNVIEHFVYEPDKDRRTFYVYPARRTAGPYVEIVVSLDPPEVNPGGSLAINPVYHEALIDYVIARAIMKDGEASGNIERANWHANAFFTGIGMGAQENATL